MLATGVRTQLHSQPNIPPYSLNICWYTHKAEVKVLLVCWHSFICLFYNNRIIYTVYILVCIVLHVKNRSWYPYGFRLVASASSGVSEPGFDSRLPTKREHDDMGTFVLVSTLLHSLWRRLSKLSLSKRTFAFVSIASRHVKIMFENNCNESHNKFIT